MPKSLEAGSKATGQVMVVSQKKESPLDAATPLVGTCTEYRLDPTVAHSCSQWHYSQQSESTDKTMDKQNVVYTFSGTLSSFKKRGGEEILTHATK